MIIYINFQHGNGSKALLQSRLKSVVGKSLTLQGFVKGRIDFPQPYLDSCWLLKVQSRRSFPDGLCSGEGLGWCQMALGCCASIGPRRTSPSPALQDPSWWAQNIKLSPRVKKKQWQVVSHKSKISLAFFTVTRALRKIADFSPHPSALPVHRSTGSCNVCSGKERVNPGSRWKAAQLQKRLKKR